jgi:hypothetical protein
MESREEGGPVWLPMDEVSFAAGSSSSTDDKALRRGSFHGRPVFVQALTTNASSSGGGGDDTTWAHLQYNTRPTPSTPRRMKF